MKTEPSRTLCLQKLCTVILAALLTLWSVPGTHATIIHYSRDTAGRLTDAFTDKPPSSPELRVAGTEKLAQ